MGIYLFYPSRLDSSSRTLVGCHPGKSLITTHSVGEFCFYAGES